MTEPFYQTEQTICRARIVLLSTGFFNQFLKMSCVHYRVSAKPVCLFAQMDPQIMNKLNFNYFITYRVFLFF